MSATLPQLVTPKTYASRRNARFNNKSSIVVTIPMRWQQALNSMPASQRRLVEHSLGAMVAEFRRRNPHLKSWKDMDLTEAKLVKMNEVGIDVTMQRPLDVGWVLTLMSKFTTTMVQPINVYKDQSSPLYIAWDGQHTVVLLWLIATQIFGESLDNCSVYINLSPAKTRDIMRKCFVELNSSLGRKDLDEVDRFEQMTFGVRVDGNTDPDWIKVSKKQQMLEDNDLFVTHKKYGDENEPNAISRMPEILHMDKSTTEPTSFGWLCKYLAMSTCGQRPVDEKEMVMMSHFFDRCRIDNINVDDAYIQDIVDIFRKNFNCDFSPLGPFWAKVQIAYNNWYKLHSSVHSNAKQTFKKEPYNGFPFMIAQLNKDFQNKTMPRSDGSSPFWPASVDLW